LINTSQTKGDIMKFFLYNPTILLMIVLFCSANVLLAQNIKQSIDKAPIDDTKIASSFNSYALNPMLNNLCYGTNATENSWVSLSIASPDSFNTISTIGDWLSGGDFDNYGYFYGISLSTSTLLKITPTTGFVTNVGTVSGVDNGYTITSMAFEPNTKTMYLGATSGVESKLYTINISSATATFVGNIGAQTLITLAINNAGSMYGIDITTDYLIKIDRFTGTATTIGAIGYDLNYAQDADFDPANDSLYLFGYANEGILLSIDTTSGAATQLAAFGSNEITAFGVNNPYPVSVNPENNPLNSFQLNQNYPNPFNPVTKIQFTIPSGTLSGVEGSRVQLKVYDIIGNEVATLVDEYKPVGSYEVEFDASKFTSGVYFYRLQAVSFVETKKMVLLR
jgi:hypothetical protein